MKTAISIPDPIFQAAECMAKRLGMSRSELFTVAMSKYMKENKYQDVTEELNKVYCEGNQSVDEMLSKMQAQSLSKEEW